MLTASAEQMLHLVAARQFAGERQGGPFPSQAMQY
jgi:hypothetical protein